MAGFLYYFAGDQPPDLPALGFPHAAEVELPTAANIERNGPDGGAGFCVRIEDRCLGIPRGPRRTPPTALMRPGLRWEPTGRYWTGWDPAQPPRADDLLRARVFPGEAVRLRDGGDWIIPSIHNYAGATSLPWRYRFVRGAEAAAEIVPEHRSLYDDAVAVAEGYAAETLQWQDGFRFAARLLGVNHVMGWTECVLLELLSTDEVAAVLRAGCIIAEKKTSLAERLSTPG